MRLAPPFPESAWSHRRSPSTIVAAFDIDTGQALTQVIGRNDSATFAAFLTMLGQAIDPAKDIHIVLDNGSSHVAKHTRAWLAVMATPPAATTSPLKAA